MNDRELHIHMARVHLFHARVSRHHPGWHATLLRWAAERRIRAMMKTTEAPAQLDLFGA
ncbi:hypothetical protein [Paraburkholderia sp. Cpub6]|uniref:hypothetical protein n=1 Tax=Paraburkholderia sp. Cpub6 TaxID=2723094 RepID=UPI0016078695|nr:hypothetical protein [Paraburkholderia sp. Cpub6]MBB5462919.1 hypothetical protein [Paraburkholderia sp. Cpub6]